MQSFKLVHGLAGLVAVLIASVSSSDILIQAPFKVQSFAAPPKHRASTSIDPKNQVTFTNCQSNQYSAHGTVTSGFITPCNRASSDAPCTFVHGSNYTIELDFVTSLDATRPRSSVIAYDTDGQYQYSGQSFNACKYAKCPIHAYKSATYIYHFATLKSPFSALLFNVTQDFTGPSLFCARVEINFQ